MLEDPPSYTNHFKGGFGILRRHFCHPLEDGPHQVEACVTVTHVESCHPVTTSEGHFKDVKGTLLIESTRAFRGYRVV